MKLEDFEIWKLANELVKDLYNLSVNLPKEEEYGLKSQIRRFVVSIAANIAEGFGRYYYLDKVRFYYYARGSLEETKSHIFIVYNLKYINEDAHKDIQLKIRNIGAKLNNTIFATYKQRSKL